MEKTAKELSSSQAFMISNPAFQIVPVNFGLKYKPPKLGLQYQIANKETTVKDASVILPTFVHEISLQWVTADSDVELVFNEIINANQQFLNSKLVAPAQVRRLIDRFINYLRDNKENASANKPIH